jgi:hypothetical protein
MSWRVTHFDLRGHRHQVTVHGCNRTAAETYAEGLFGEARQIRVIRLMRAVD